MADVHDVAAYILSRTGTVSTMKLQKLAYYSQAWHLVWTEKRLFDDRIEAWANGPVVPNLYKNHRKEFEVSKWPWGEATNLEEREQATIDKVVSFYGEKDPQWLSDLTHMETPWRDARGDLRPGDRSNAEITPQSMLEYYSGL